MKELTITRPDDWHCTCGDGNVLPDLVRHTAERFHRAIVMPNLKPPVTTTAAALAYRERILQARPAGSDFDPLMTLYLTDQLKPQEIRLAVNSKHVKAVKYYPAGATTNSDSGVTAIENVYAVLETMAETGFPCWCMGRLPTIMWIFLIGKKLLSTQPCCR